MVVKMNDLDPVLACGECGSDNLWSLFAKHEGEPCREMGCFGTMRIMPDMEARSLRVLTAYGKYLERQIGKAP